MSQEKIRILVDRSRDSGWADKLANMEPDDIYQATENRGNGKISVLGKVSEDMDILISADDDTITKVIAGVMTPYEAYLQNELSIRPIVNSQAAGLLEILFPYTPIMWLEAI